MNCYRNNRILVIVRAIAIIVYDVKYTYGTSVNIFQWTMDPIGIYFHANFLQVAENISIQIEVGISRIRDTSNPFELPSEKFIKLFRLNDQNFRLNENLINELREFVEERRVDQVPFHLQVLLCLNFYGHGGYQTTVGQDVNLAISQPVVSRIINKISHILAVHLLPRYVKFPTTNEEIRFKKQRFMEKLGFPYTIGAIDGTQIAKVPPKVDDGVNPAVAYINRKGYHSITVQTIFDADMIILNINARYSGSTFVKTFHLREKYQQGREDTGLIGDSGYPLQLWLMTPINNAAPNTPEAVYTSRHCHARNVVERGIGTWKERFRCLKKDRVLHYMHGVAGKIIYACAVLHNICKIHNLPDIINEEIHYNGNDQIDDNANENIDPDINILMEGRLVRRQLINLIQDI